VPSSHDHSGIAAAPGAIHHDLAADKLRGVDAIAAFIGEHPATVYRWLQLGWLDAWKLGNLWVSTKSRLIRQFDEQRFVPPADKSANTASNPTTGPGPEPPPAPIRRRRSAPGIGAPPIPSKRALQTQHAQRRARTTSRATRGGGK
jgi:hypothetical protein